VASHAAASKSAVVEEDVDPKAAKIVKAHRPTGESAGATATVHGTGSAASLSKEVTPSGGAGDATPAPQPKRRAGRPPKPVDTEAEEIKKAFQLWYSQQVGQKKDQ